ncbi:MAG: helix-turn-helix transcriptional regulator [Geminicoccaceae bacterium]
MGMPAETPDRGLAGCESGDRFFRIGAALRVTREARGEHLNDTAQWLRIRPAFLAALEAGDLQSLPGRVYAAGFLRSYAEHLGLDLTSLDSRHRKTISDPVPMVPSIHQEA